MALISKEEVQKLAVLARVPLPEAQVAQYQEDMEEILEYVAKLSHIDTSGVMPVHGGGSGVNAFRTDLSAPMPDPVVEALVASFPVREAHMTKVPPAISR